MADSSSTSGEGVLAPQDEDSALSMVEVLEEEQRLEDDANAVLGDSDDKNCTYDQGYVARQAVYACATCISPIMEPAGICLACSYECHEGHELLELYTKRKFRCDCGNSKFPDNKCKLNSKKDPVNKENAYNHNFRGQYCICNRPYPDPEDEIADEMIQCIVCEDWYHGRHLTGKRRASEDFQEMVCQQCMKTRDFLWAYAVQSTETKVVKTETNQKIDVVEIANVSPQRTETNADSKAENEVKTESQRSVRDRKSDLNPRIPEADSLTGHAVCDVGTDAKDKNEASTVTSTSRHSCETLNQSCIEPPPGGTAEKQSKVEHDESRHQVEQTQKGQEVKPVSPSVATEVDATSNRHSDGEENGSVCLLTELEARTVTSTEGATFWPQHWRKKICRCEKCKTMYREKQVSYLLEDSDTVEAYEERGKAKHVGSSQYDQGMHALSKMNRIQQVEVLHEYNDLKTELKDYLKKFAENGKIVREEDIKEFFTQMSARKRQRTEEPMQYFCK